MQQKFSLFQQEDLISGLQLVDQCVCSEKLMGNDALTKAAEGEIDYTDKGFVEAAQKLADWSEKGYFGKGVYNSRC